MATVVWRRNKQVTIYYYDTNTKKLVTLPREQTKHLDGKPKDYVYKWKEEWEKNNGRAQDRSNRINLKEKDLLSTLWRQYQSHRSKLKNRRIETVEKETELLELHIIPFFVGQHQKKDPSDWHSLIPTFHDWLFEKNLSDSTYQKVLGTLERFGKYLVFKQHTIFPFVIQSPSRKNHKITPLKIELSPEDVLNYVKNLKEEECKNVDLRLAVLVGYFAALGPGELFALEKTDFLTGQNAELETKTLARFKEHGLGSKLSVVVWKTLPAKGKNEIVINTKNETRKNIVNIWHVEAARAIGKILGTHPGGRLFLLSYSHLSRIWREKIQSKLGVTPHDLRRASALYLGRELGINPLLLQEHMRHAEIETTMLYTRRPNTPKLPSKDEQDFDDVA